MDNKCIINNTKPVGNFIGTMSPKPKVSVIIAVYNVEQFIEKCVRSLFGQTLDEIEYIFVDDCSPDNSISIMERVLTDYPERRDQVKIIRHNKNMGVSRSRQDGIDAATGEYVIHCDPDDWIELDMYEDLYLKANETDADLVICDYYSVNGDAINYHSQEPKELTSISLLESISGRNKISIHSGLWNKLIKNNYVHKAKFPYNISWCEDLCYLLDILKNDIKIAYISKPLYYYWNNPSSLGHTFNKDALEKDLNLINHLKNLAEKSTDKRYIACCKTRLILTIYWRFFCANISITDYLYRLSFDYQKNIFLNRSLKIYPKILLFLSVNGQQKQAKSLMKFLSGLKKYIMRSFLINNSSLKNQI